MKSFGIFFLILADCNGDWWWPDNSFSYVLLGHTAKIKKKCQNSSPAETRHPQTVITANSSLQISVTTRICADQPKLVTKTRHRCNRCYQQNSFLPKLVTGAKTRHHQNPSPTINTIKSNQKSGATIPPHHQNLSPPKLATATHYQQNSSLPPQLSPTKLIRTTPKRS